MTKTILHNSAPGHDKLYEVSVIPSPRTSGTFCVLTRWGRRPPGSNQLGVGAPGAYKVRDVSYACALDCYRSTIFAKRQRGYREIFSQDDTSFAQPQPSVRPSTSVVWPARAERLPVTASPFADVPEFTECVPAGFQPESATSFWRS